MTSEKDPATPNSPNYTFAYTSTSVIPQRTQWWRRIRWTDILLVFFITVMLVWPWIFFGVVWARHGIQMNNDLADFVMNHPRNTNFFVTFLGTAVRLIVGYLFSEAIVRFCQEWAVDHHINLFHISLISGLKNQKLPWGVGDLGYLYNPKKGFRVAIVVACWGCFLIVPSGTTSLLTPVPFSRTAPLQGTELDFSSSAADCIAWLNQNMPPDACGWTVSWMDL